MPHDPQKVRMTLEDDGYSVRSPATKEKLLAANVTQATTGDPAAFLHVGQWQKVALLGGP